MEKAFKEMVFEWEYLHPKCSLTDEQEQDLNGSAIDNEQDPNPTELIPAAVDKELDGEAMEEEEIFQEEAMFSDEVLVLDEAVVLEEDKEETDWGLQSLLFKEEVGEVDELVELEDQEINEKHVFEAFGLKKWLRSVGVAAATVSIFLLGGGRAQMMEKAQRIQLDVTKKEETKDYSVQKKKAASPSLSLYGHYDERF